MKRLIRLKLYIILAISFTLTSAYGQQRIDPTLEVKRDFDTQLSEITKGRLEPSFADTLGIFNLNFRYSIFDKPLRNLYDFNPVLTTKPQSYAKVKEPVFFISAGSNFPLNPYGNLYIQPNLGRSNSLIIYANHQSYLSKLNNVQFDNEGYTKRGEDKLNAPSNLSNIGLSHRLTWKEFELGSNININSGMFSYYWNKDHSNSYLKDSSSHKYTISSFRFYSKSNRKNHNSVSYNFDVNYSILKDDSKFISTFFPIDIISGPFTDYSLFNNEVKENLFNLSFEAGVGFADYNTISVSTNYQSSNLKRGAISQIETDRSNMVLHPKFNFKKGRWNFELGLKYNQWWIDDIDDYNIYLNAKARFEISPNKLYAYAFIDGQNNMMSYHQLLSKNPWISPNIDIENIEQPVISRIGINGKIANNISFNIYGGYYEYKNQIYFYYNNDSNAIPWFKSMLSSSLTTESEPITPYSYNANYGAEEKRFGIGGEISFDSRHFEGRVSTDIFSFKDKNNFSDRHYNYSPIEINGYFRYNLKERLVISSDFTFKNKAPILYSKVGTDITHHYTKMNTSSYFNLNTKVSYNYNKNLTFFATLNNILNAHITFISHNSMPGINGGLGLSYKF